MKIFVSYPHDANAVLVKRITADLRARGHEVWFDESEIREGDDWRSRITRGVLDSQQVLAFLSRHAVRDPGVCLNEIAIALAEKGDEALVTVLVEPELDVQAPVSVTHVQWLRMEDWARRIDDEGWYRSQLDRLIDVLEHPGRAGRHDELEQLRLALDPLGFNADMTLHLARFSGRRWIVERFGQWLADEPTSRVLRIEGGPGMGKTALVSHLVHTARSNVLAVHLCQVGRGDSRNPMRMSQTLAYQLATRLPDYRARLLRSPLIQRPELMQGKDAASLWSALVAEPLAGVGRGLIERQRLALVIDGLDEASEGGRNDIVNLLAAGIKSLPGWIGVVLTGRPDPEVTQRLSQYQPFTISGDDPRNRADLQAYADAWLAEEVAAKTLTAAQARQAASQLVDRSEGAFLYLTQAREAAKEGALDLSRPQAFPAGLGAIYLGFFERRFPDVNDEASLFARAVRPLLGYVLACPEPLPLALARELLGWASDDAGELLCQRALQAMGSLLRHGKDDKGQPTLAPFHHSVREWMQDAARSGAFVVPTRQARLRLATYLWRDYLRDGLQIPGFVWQVLPEVLGQIDGREVDGVLGPVDRSSNIHLINMADSLSPKLRFAASLPLWRLVVERGVRLCKSAPENAEFARDLSISHGRLGEVQHTLGDTEAALAQFQRGVQIAERLARAAPENAQYAHDLSITHARLGDALGNTQAALAQYDKSMQIAERLARAAPENAAFARGLSISTSKLGGLQRTLGHTEAALALIQQSMQIAERLARDAPENAQYAHDLSISHGRLGDALGNTQAALAHYQQSLQILERLVRDEPDNARFASDLSLRHNKLGDLHHALDNNEAAVAQYQQSLRIRERLAHDAPENAVFARDLAVSHDRLGALQQDLGNTGNALAHYQLGMQIIERLARAAPENAGFERDLSISHRRLGDALGNTQAAMAQYQQSLQILERLARAAPENVEFARDLSISHDKLGDLQRALGHTDAALAQAQQGVQIAERLVRAAPENAQYARDLSISHMKLGDLQQALGQSEAALAHYEKQMHIAERLARAAPENAQFARGLWVGYWRLGSATAGETQVSWRKAALKVLAGLKTRGVLPKADEKFLVQLQQQLAADNGPDAVPK